MASTSPSKLQERLARPPENWVDAVVIALVADPYVYGGAARAAFVVLAIIALGATKVLVDSIAADEKRESRAEKEAGVTTKSSSERGPSAKKRQ